MAEADHELEHEPDEPAVDRRFAKLFAALDADAAPIDHEFLATLRGRSAEAFAEESKQPVTRRFENRSRFNLFGLAAAATAAAVVVTAIWWSTAVADDQPTFGAVLAEVSKADTLELEVARDGKTEQLLVKQPAKSLRWNHADGTYDVARGNQQWNIDEAANRATSRVSSFFPVALPGLNLLAVLTPFDGLDWRGFDTALPAEQVERGGRVCNIYRWNIGMDNGPLAIEAAVEAQTRRLLSLQAERQIDGRPQPAVAVNVVAVNRPVDEGLFVVGKTLTEDGRVGKVADVQGIVTLKPVMHRRWTPVGTHMLVHPGDWVRTDIRGANAVALQLVKDTRVTIGPDTLVEVIKPNQLRIVNGELKIIAEENAAVELLGPNEEKLTVAGTAIVRLVDEKLVRLERPPLWLAGFEGATNNESIGSLVAKVDGRDVPLTVGYHKVSVDIRDQIARTVIEESFVNHTPGRLEGVFYFPLPQDASISGFGMWIGSELVEADIVEKQRAREIYETILRERRDPGLLEWTGGNIFKARVFPIEPHSEKRIKISYTQVLPLRGREYRYSYGLRSELLKQHPLRELAIDVKLSSVLPLAKIHSPTHTAARIDTTPRSAHVEFAAQEFTPDRDFEVVAELAENQPKVVMVPHRRGDDGYFMLMLSPPGGAGEWQRDVLPDGEPQNLLILADTSASMDAPSRAAQAEFVAALLSSLAPEDKFNVATCDVDCDWAFTDSQAASETNIEAARDRLANRVSLGWTDLDRAFESALTKAGEPASASGKNDPQIIYVGDGIVTTRDADPTAFAKRLRLLCEGKDVALHAVSVSSSFEPVVLKAIASLGGGSVRQISGERTPQSVAAELLGELSRPTLRDFRVEFTGIETARVYPRDLPNLPAGSQQILLGRYLPRGADQMGSVTVTGMLGGESVRFRTDVSLANVAEAADAADDMSFIPRLWARMHLDALLEQGASQSIQDEIIALSEEYHIMTPYTSLLVLESDEDRERFKVKPRFQMRDAERYFAEGRDNVDYELLGQQMRRAGTWRIGLRQQVLAELLALGRNSQVIPQANEVSRRLNINQSYPLGQSGVFFNRGEIVTRSGMFDGEAWYGQSGAEFNVMGVATFPVSDFVSDPAMPGQASSRLSLSDGSSFELDRGGLALDEVSFESVQNSVDGLDKSKDNWAWNGRALNNLKQLELAPGFVPTEESSRAFNGEWLDFNEFGSEAIAGKKPASRPRSFLLSSSGLAGGFGGGGGGFGGGRRGGRGPYGRDYYATQQYTSWLNTLFPALPVMPVEEKPVDAAALWPDEARELVSDLLRTEALARLAGGLRVERQTEGFDARWDELTSRGNTLELISPAAWLVRTSSIGAQAMVQWCSADERGIYSAAYELGRQRKSSPRDLARPPVGLPSHLLTSLERAYYNYKAELRPQAEGQMLLVLSPEHNPGYEVRYLIDPVRKVVLSIENRQDGQITSSVRYDEFVEVAGAWWPGRTQSFDKDERRTSVTVDKFTALAADVFAQEVSAALAGRDRVQFLSEPLPGHAAARRALDAGRADFDDHIRLMLRFCENQEWDKVLEHLAAAEKLAGEKRGMRWVRDAILNISGRGEELNVRILARAAELAAPPAGSTYANEHLFLASYLVGQAGSVAAGNEMLALLDVLKPVYERQPAYVAAMKGWTQNRAAQLRSVGRPDEAIALQKQLAADYPHDVSLQIEYASALFNVGQYDAAYEWLDQVTTDAARWHAHEDQRLRETYLGFLESQGRWFDAADYLKRWVERNPESTAAYERYLGTLLRLDRLDEMNALIAKWLAAGRQAGKIPPADLARMQAAIAQALGEGYAIRTDRLDERWLDPLAETVRFFARHESQTSIAERILNNQSFRQSDQCRQLRREYLAVLAAEIATLKPAEISRFVGWVMANDPAVENDTWQPIATRLQERWAAEADPDVKHELAAPLVHILSSRFPDEFLAFMRRQLAEGPEKYRTSYAHQLFNLILSRPWSVEIENEALGLLERLVDPSIPSHKLSTQVAALHRITDRMVQARFAALMAQVEHQEKLTRIELRDKQQENMRLAREGFADRLRQARQDASPELRPWINIERLYLETILGRDLDQVAGECWEYLGRTPPPANPEADTDDASEIADTNAALAQHLNQVLRARYLITAANIAARRNAKSEHIERLLAYVDAAIEQAPPEDMAWKFFKYQLLVALDRPQDLEANLRTWIRVDDPLNYWRVSLAYVLAEQGKLAEAVTLLEAVQADGELGPGEFRTLADWYMALDQRQKHEDALLAIFATAQEWELQQWLWQQLRPWQIHGAETPSELDKNVLRVFATLFKKSGSPQNYAYQLREYYRATRDFRLLAGLAEAVIGHTGERIYPFLQSLDQVFGEVREEATVDSMVDEIEKVRTRAKSPLDLRALDLLEVIVQRRASMLQNQPGPHAARALAALRRAFERERQPGEERWMADFLANLGTVREDDFSEEQRRELAVLHEATALGSPDRLHIGHARARCLWGYSMQDEAIDLLEAGLNEFRAAHNGVLTTDANGPLDTYLSYLESRGFHARGEQVVFDELKHPADAQQTLWLRLRLYRLYRSALASDGDVSIGKGPELFKAVQVELQKELDTPDHNHRHALVDEMCNIYVTAHEKKLPECQRDLRAFAFERMPAVLRAQTTNYQSIVQRVGDTLRQLIGPRDGLEFFVTCIEREPKWFRYSNESGWNRFGWQLAEWRKEAANAGQFDAALQERLLAIVLVALRRDLESQQYDNRYLYHRDFGGDRYWSDKEADFRRTAEEVYAERKSSGEAVKYIAEYVYHGLHHFNRAIDILFIAHNEGRLDEEGQFTLVTYLFEQNRHGESIALLEPLVKLRPDNMEYRTRLMHAYFRTERRAELLALLQATDEYFHAENRWSEGPLAALASSTLENNLFEQSVTYFEELIPLHQRTQPNRGIGNGTLSSYYGQMARAYAGLKNTPKAVDAACGAIVSWGPTHQNRREAVQALNEVLRNAPDLDGFVVELNRQVEESGLENPVVRKALGVVFVSKQEYAKAIPQLELARDAQPNDVETHKLLVECYDHQNDRAGAVRQLLASIELSRRDIELFKDLGRRYRELEQPAEAERAVTSIVEMLPSESESHAMLAEIRQEENRWSDAIHEWRRVSEIRRLEPTGLTKLAAAQIHERDWNAARETLRQLRAREWPSRFPNVENEVRELERQIEQAQP